METVKSCKLTIDGKSRLRMDGVNNVLGFAEDFVTLDTLLGRVIIEGEELKIESLNKDGGIIDVSGVIVSVLYSDNRGKSGVFKRMFK